MTNMTWYNILFDRKISHGFIQLWNKQHKSNKCINPCTLNADLPTFVQITLKRLSQTCLEKRRREKSHVGYVNKLWLWCTRSFPFITILQHILLMMQGAIIEVLLRNWTHNLLFIFGSYDTWFFLVQETFLEVKYSHAGGKIFHFLWLTFNQVRLFKMRSRLLSSMFS